LAVEDSKLLGIKDNRAFLASILRNDTFIQGNATTAFIGEDFSQDPSLQPLQAKETEVALAASILCALNSNVSTGTGWQNNRTGSRVIKLSCEDQTFELALTAVENTITVDFSSIELASTNAGEAPQAKPQKTIKIIEQSESTLKYLYDDVIRTVTYSQTKGAGEALGCDQVHLAARYGNLTFTDISLQSTKKNKGGSDQVLASMDGGMVDVMVKVGDVVEVGQTLAVLEAMKMEHPLKAGIAGTIAEVLVQAGDQVKGRQKLIQILAAAAE
jgi:geranyl-CoA carboxylase alpha subunit